MNLSRSAEFYDIVDMLDKRLNDKGKNWRHVLKALKVLDYCLHEGSEMIVTWARKNIYIIKTLREFMYIDEEGRDVGQNGASKLSLSIRMLPILTLFNPTVRVAAKELTALILDEDRLRAERADRKTWKSRVTGIEEFGPDHGAGPSRQRAPRRRNSNDEDDLEYKLAIEASKNQEEEDRKRRESRQGPVGEDDDLAKAIKLSREEEERRRRELEESNASSLFDDDPTPSSQPQFTGINGGYQQGNNVDWLGNPIDQSQPMQSQPTGYMNNAYTGYNNGYPNGFAAQPTGMYNNPYGQQPQQQQQAFQQQQHLQPQPQQFQMQPTGYNPYAQQQQFMPQPTASPEPSLQPGSNNPWASNRSQSPIQATKTGSNNPFASGFQRPQTSHVPPMPSLNNLQSLPEQKSLQAFPSQPQTQSQPSFSQPPPQKQLSEHEQKLNSLLAAGDGMDTFGNTGELRIPSQHTAPGTFVNSAGSGAQRLTAEATGNNPFLRQQYTGMPAISYGGQQMPAATGPAGMNGMNGFGGGSNPFAPRPQQQQQSNQQGADLIQF